MTELHYKNKNIIAISDTHGFHRKLIIPETDILIHCGDACNDGSEDQLQDFFQWFSEQPAKYKIFLAGNHDLGKPIYRYRGDFLLLCASQTLAS